MVHESGRMSKNLLLNCVLVAFRNVLPVGDLPDCLDVIGTDVLVLQVIGVLPNINTKQRNETSSWFKRILKIRVQLEINKFCYLVGASGNLQTLLSRIVTKPSPTRTLNANRRSTQTLLHLF